MINTGVNYSLFYEILLALREDFHSYGRIDDSNMKLDEIVKLILLSYHTALRGKQFSLLMIKEEAKKRFGNEDQVAPVLRAMFEEAATDNLFLNADGTSIFGANIALNIQPSENLFAERLISEIEKIDFIHLIQKQETNNFDIINECFGHFVRENFRNNKEDAQYMTPAEIAIPILNMIFHDFECDGYFDIVDAEHFTVMDPTCGVGTLLIEASRHYIEAIREKSPTDTDEGISHFLKHGMIGQDKVDRMVRLSKINALLMGGNSQNIYVGNSIIGNSVIDSYKGKVDLIFTNPPFGAECSYQHLIQDDFAFLDKLNISSQNVCSELLMLLKCISLLKPNGKLAIVLPDSVFSAKGLSAQVRTELLSRYTINAIVEMPAVTFAQAGTRTKTSILYLTNTPPQHDYKVTMGICTDIGYIVKERVGVPVKIQSGHNELEEIASVYCDRGRFTHRILETTPSVTLISPRELIDEVLNPSFYSASRLQTLYMLENCDDDGYELKPLSDIANFVTIGRRNLYSSDTVKHISILHINPDSTIDFQQVLSYDPISKGRLCNIGDILFSKINPRIPRMAVVPESDVMLVCSNEFEILQPKADIGPYAICFLLKTSYVSRQIEDLTSGTSSSHSRIKREQLAEIKVPYPISKDAKAFISQINDLIEKSFKQKYTADEVLREQLQKLESIFMN